jgi:hypothetical protein
MLRTVLNSVKKNTTRAVVVPSASRSMASSADELTLEVRSMEQQVIFTIS